ncbi:MAG: PilZ domain-containing protein [Gammaproteobacteria bacterium]
MAANAGALNRRAVYRVRPQGADVRITIESPDGTFDVEAVADLSAAGAALLLPAGAPASLREGEYVRLWIGSPHVQVPHAVHARVIGRRPSAHGALYRFAFDGGGQAFDGAYGAFFEVFNRRAAQRGTPAVERSSLGARLRVDAPRPAEYDVDVLNISGGGLCVATDIDVDAELAGASAVVARIDLPRPGVPVELRARVCYRAVDDSAVIYGLTFDTADPALYGVAGEALQSFVLERFEREYAPY